MECSINKDYITYFRHLCTSGLDFGIIFPSLLKAMMHIIDAQYCKFIHIDCQNRSTDIYFKNLNELFNNNLKDKKINIQDDLSKIITSQEFEVDFYAIREELYYPGPEKGSIQIYREKNQGKFSAREKELLSYLTNYIKNSMRIRICSNNEAYLETGEKGIICFTADGSIRNICDEIRNIFFSNQLAGSNCSIKTGKIFEEISAIAKSIVNQSNEIDRKLEKKVIVFLDSKIVIYPSYIKGLTSEKNLLIMDIKIFKPAKLVIAKNTISLKLSPKEKEICLFLGLSMRASEIIHKLDITRNTYKDYIKKIYAKLNINSREDLRDVLLKNNSCL